eukprot:358486-Chlamydomonas_euryale.AAC.2
MTDPQPPPLPTQTLPRSHSTHACHATAFAGRNVSTPHVRICRPRATDRGKISSATATARQSPPAQPPQPRVCDGAACPGRQPPCSRPSQSLAFPPARLIVIDPQQRARCVCGGQGAGTRRPCGGQGHAHPPGRCRAPSAACFACAATADRDAGPRAARDVCLC